MGILTDISEEFNDEEEVIRIFCVTKFGINNRTQLNRIAGRASTATGVGQRTLVAAAYDEEDIDLVWNKGLGVTVKPEDKFEKAKDIDYKSEPMDMASKFGDILPAFIQDKIEFENFNEGQTLHIWEIPYSVSERRF